jgi:predicted AAA+ superfamily ATPase
MKKMVKRERYLAKLRLLRGARLIKIITGIRRCGKSTLFVQFQQELLRSGVKPKNILSINLEEMENEALLDRHVLHTHILKNCAPGRKNYVFLDEIQNVPNFEKLVDSLFVKPYIDLYLTGSNANFLSSDLATLLTGRCVEIRMLPFSFAEFAQNAPAARNQTELFEDFILYGGFPEASNMLNSRAKSQINNYLTGIYSAILENDIMKRKKIRSRFDFENLFRFMLDSVGSLVSPNNIAGTLAKNGQKINKQTVENYLQYLADGFLLTDVRRYDIKGKKLLQTLGKYYVADTGLLLAVLGRHAQVNRGHLLENLIYLELARRYKNVFVGKAAAAEVDFVCQDENGLLGYYQVALTVRQENTLARELAPLNRLNDHFPKYLLTLDPEEPTHNGIRQLNVINWLLQEEQS